MWGPHRGSPKAGPTTVVTQGRLPKGGPASCVKKREVLQEAPKGGPPWRVPNGVQQGGL
jgi:hypothetical protein